MLVRLESESCDVEMTFPYFVNKEAPVSKVQSLLDYEVSFIGKVVNGVYTNTTKVVIEKGILLVKTAQENLKKIEQRVQILSKNNELKDFESND